MSAKSVLKVLYVVSWIIFIGVCIEAGGFITNAVFAVVKPGAVKYLWKEVDLSALLEFDRGQFVVVMLFMSIVAVLRVWLFYLIIKILGNKKDSLEQPFNENVRRFLFSISYVSLMIGLFSYSGFNYVEWVQKKGVTIPNGEYLRLGGADVWMFTSVILFVIAHIFKRGIEIQKENELTV